MTSPVGRNLPSAGTGAAVVPSTWATWREARAVLARPPHLRRTATIALVVGTILFCINQLDVVLQGEADAIVWVKAAVTYLVPFCVSCAGVLVGTRCPPDPAGSPDAPAGPDIEREVT
ncbi:MAG: nitrate/nitrite transporter NrtS [Acidimicrobiales bacterium]